MSVTTSPRAPLRSVPQPAIEIESTPPVERIETTPRVPRPGVAAVWGDALSTFSVRAAPILFLALVGFAGAAILCTALSAAFGLQFYVYASGPFATHTGLAGLRIERFGIFDGHVANTRALLLVQAAIGLFALSFARGAITYIALQNDNQRPALFREACRATLERFPSLIMGSLVYGGLIACAAVGVNGLLRELCFDLSDVGQTADTFDRAWRVMALRSVDALIPNPGSPFAEFVPYWRKEGFPRLPVVMSEGSWRYEHQLPSPQSFCAGTMSGLKALRVTLAHHYHAQELWRIVIGSIVLIFSAETLLRFRTVMALKPLRSRRPQRFDVLSPLTDSLRFGFKHWGLIIVHVGLLRLAILVLTVSFLILPVVLVETFATPQAMRLIHVSAILSPTAPLIVMSIALVSAILLAFSVIYDARLAMRLGISQSTN